ncbi:alpha/beta fold hydrolase [Geodermatophilus sp. SYSU D00815]
MAPRTEGTLHLSTGLRTGFTEAGDPDGRPALLLLHSWAASRREFARLQPLLPSWLRSVAVDLRGHGDADKPASGYDVPTLARDVVAVLDALDLPAAVLVGASSGGYVAQQVAVDAPGRVDGLLLAGAPRDLHRRRAPFADEVDRLRDPVDPAWVRAFTRGFTDRPLPDWYVELCVEDALRIPAAVWRASLRGLGEAPAPTDSGAIRAPTLVVSGDRDHLLADQAAQLLAAIPHARPVRYRDAGHVVLWDEPERLAADIAAFLPTVAPSGP